MWLILASFTAFFEACKDATGKQSLKTLDEYSVLFSLMTIGAMLMLPVLFLTGGIPPIQPNFGWALLIGGSLNILAFTFYVRALKIADLSLTVPLVTLTPLFLLITAPLILQEWPTWADGTGVVLLVIGSYVLNLETAADGKLLNAKALDARALDGKPLASNFLAPLLAMARSPGSRLMLCVAFLWSITANFDKIGVMNSSSLFWVISLFSTIAAGMVPFVFLRGRNFKGILLQWKWLGIAGAFGAIAITCQMFALPLAPVSQVVAVKRMSTLISVFFGHFFFAEQGLRSRLLGAAIMVSGVAVMSLK
ncbi:MAG: DMT family transporter [Cyanobacteria bacterium P01_D01_bin.105]